MIENKIKIGDKVTLENIFKDHWKEIGTYGSSIHFGKGGVYLFYDREKGEVSFMYEK